MQPKSRIVVALFFAVLGTTSGCSSNPPPPPSPDPVTLRVACPPGSVAKVVRRGCKGWQGRNNTTVEVIEYGAAGPEASGADAWVIAPAELGRWAAAGQLLPIPDALQNSDNPFAWKGLLPLYREHLLLWDRTVFALPLVGDVPLFCYRHDLFDDAKRPAPQTWQDVEEAAAYFHKELGKPSLPPLPADDDALEREFYTLASCYAHQAIDAAPFEKAFFFHYDLQGKPRLAEPGFVDALALLQRLQKYRAPAGKTPVEAFRGQAGNGNRVEGVGVCCLIGPEQVARLQEQTSMVRDKFTVVRVPAGPRGNWVPYFGAGGWLTVVPKSSPHPEEAFALLADLGGRETSRQVVLAPRTDPPLGGGAFRYDHLDRTARWEAFGLDAPRTDILRKAVQETLEHRNVANPTYRLRTPDEREHRAILLAALRKALQEPASDPAPLLADVARRWEERDRLNPTHLEQYRVSLWFPPR